LCWFNGYVVECKSGHRRVQNDRVTRRIAPQEVLNFLTRTTNLQLYWSNHEEELSYLRRTSRWFQLTTVAGGEFYLLGSLWYSVTVLVGLTNVFNDRSPGEVENFTYTTLPCLLHLVSKHSHAKKASTKRNLTSFMTPWSRQNYD
jgi:hypothetical protein